MGFRKKFQIIPNQCQLTVFLPVCMKKCRLNWNGHLFAQAIRQANDLYLLNVYKDVGEGSNASCQITETNTVTGKKMGNSLSSYTNPTHKTINDDHGGNLTISLSDITGETVYTFSYSQKNNFGSKNQEKYADPESTLFRHFLTKIRTVLCTTIYTCVDSHWFELITFEYLFFGIERSWFWKYNLFYRYPKKENFFCPKSTLHPCNFFIYCFIIPLLCIEQHWKNIKTSWTKY